MVSEYRPTAWFGSLLAVTMVAGVHDRSVRGAGGHYAAAASCSARRRSARRRVPLRDAARSSSLQAGVAARRICWLASLGSDRRCRGAGRRRLRVGDVDVFPDVRCGVGRAQRRDRAAGEDLRRADARHRRAACELTAAGFVEASSADRRGGTDERRDSCRPRELHLEASLAACGPAGRLQPRRLGAARRVSADRRRQPARPDAVLLRGAIEARLPVAAGSRAGGCRPIGFDIEGVYVPCFRRGRFDELDDDIVAVQPAPTIDLRDAAPSPCLRVAADRRRTATRLQMRKAARAPASPRDGSTGRLSATEASRRFPSSRSPGRRRPGAPADGASSGFRVHDDRRRLRDGARRVGRPRRGRGLRRRRAAGDRSAVRGVTGDQSKAGIGVDRKAGAYR